MFVGIPPFKGFDTVLRKMKLVYNRHVVLEPTRMGV